MQKLFCFYYSSVRQYLFHTQRFLFWSTVQNWEVVSYQKMAVAVHICAFGTLTLFNDEDFRVD